MPTLIMKSIIPFVTGFMKFKLSQFTQVLTLYRIADLFPEVQIIPNDDFLLQHKFSRFESSLSQNIEILCDVQELHRFSSIIIYRTCNLLLHGLNYKQPAAEPCIIIIT